MNSTKAGATYFAIIFLLGFVLGSARVLFVIPRIGALAATLLELPVILAASWFVSGWLIKKLQVAPEAGSRLFMGSIAFALTMIAEPLLGFAFGRSMAEQYEALVSPVGLLGLGGQAVFGLMPFLWLVTRSK